MKFWFDYIWYRIYKYYNDKSDSTAISSASISLSAGICGNCMALYFPLNYYHENIFILTTRIVLIFAGVLLLLISLRYNKKRIEILSSAWSNEDEKKKKVNGWLTIMYLAISLIVMVSVAGYFGNLRNK
jgi:hypothetical protein